VNMYTPVASSCLVWRIISRLCAQCTSAHVYTVPMIPFILPGTTLTPGAAIRTACRRRGGKVSADAAARRPRLRLRGRGVSETKHSTDVESPPPLRPPPSPSPPPPCCPPALIRGVLRTSTISMLNPLLLLSVSVCAFMNA